MRATRPMAEHLINAIGAVRHIPDHTTRRVHEVRNYRNVLVHERDDVVDPIPVPECRSRLCTYFDRLPIEW
jgi:hypothetical protein